MRARTRECGLSCARDAVSLKHDYLWIREPGSFIETRVWVREGMVHYNTERPHSSLKYLAPAEFAKRMSREVNE